MMYNAILPLAGIHESLQHMVLEQLGITCKKMYLDTDHTLLSKTSSKWITDLRAKYRTIKLLEDNIGENIDDLWCGDAFLDTTTPNIIYMIEKIDHLVFIKTKNFFVWKRQYQEN